MRLRYKNTISEVFQIDKPFLCLGGLLADVSILSFYATNWSSRLKAYTSKDMGLGKTLSMLALITTLLDKVENIFAERDPRPRNTTLIITPLSRKFQGIKSNVLIFDFSLHDQSFHLGENRSISKTNIISQACRCVLTATAQTHPFQHGLPSRLS